MDGKLEIIRTDIKDQISSNFISQKFEKNNFKNKKRIEEIEKKENQTQLENELIDRKKSSDSTSITTSQIDTLSQNSESSLFFSNIINQKDLNKNENEEEVVINYYDGIESYFFNIMPEKFINYKKTKNFLPKNRFKEKEEKIIQKQNENENIKDDDKIIKNNKFNQNSFQINQNPLYYAPFTNLFYCAYNPFYFNYPFTKLSNKDLNQTSDKERKNIEQEIKNEDIINNNISKEGQEQEQEQVLEQEQEQDQEEDVIYIIKKQKKNKNYNKNYYKDKEQRNNKDNKNKILNININKKNINDKYQYKHKNNYKIYNYNKDYHNNSIINKTYYRLNHNKQEKIKNYYNSNYYNIKKPCKIIYY